MPWALNTAGSGAAVQSGKDFGSGRNCAGLAENQTFMVLASVSTNLSPAPVVKPLAIRKRVPGICARSSGCCTPQTKDRPPTGAPQGGGGLGAGAAAGWAEAGKAIKPSTH